MEESLETVHQPSLHRQWRFPQFGLHRRRKDRFAGMITGILALVAGLIVPAMTMALFIRTRPILATHSLDELLFSTHWNPLRGQFGFYPFILGTLWVTAVGMVLAVPPSLLTAIYLAEYVRPRTRSMVMPFIDLLAGIPSVVYGIWCLIVVVPFIEKVVAPFLHRYLDFIPIFSSSNPTGYGVLAGGVVLAVMVFPIIIAVSESVVHAVPQGLREASLSLGATRWQTIKHVSFRQARSGMVAAVVLGFSRAFGETMAVLMVVGNVPQTPNSIFDAAYPLTALIANNYGEMMSIPLYDSALMGAALILLFVVLLFNIGSRLALLRLRK